MDQVLRFVDQGGLILGVCNGFQLMVKAGLLPGFDNNYEERMVSLTYNDSGRFEDRWITCSFNQNSPSVFTKGLENMDLPIRHGEGKFVAKDSDTLDKLEKSNLIVMQYVDKESGKPTNKYPDNPNGSELAIAGICDPTGRLMGLMPHPEAFHHKTNHPHWTRKEMPEEGAGIAIFRNGIEYLRRNVV